MNKKIKTYYLLTAFTIFMFGFSYMLVPIYEVFCEITGLNGKTGSINSTLVIEKPVERFVRVQFTSNVINSAPFKFSPGKKEMVIQPGKIYTTFYTLTNQSNQPLLATANPSITPGKYAEYFKKIECFCFTHQQINANETKELAVQFIVDKKLPSEATSLVLAYTMFDITKQLGYKLEK
ncbi:MAG: cytochrome c oxidase assembly protein [Gammaproteobacteria bacterium]|jgi:cytochrome c oxidase assembly protein subunit 11|nr:cytochrome c oxidase assembly protein [Gammaproteobacteria bacterium]|tara:strand:- start:51 stop:587 length:537 start_codon:yes stop_codon:yes gene_type:complete